ncbi:MAG: hypothetical protein A2504_08035 [Bdellovibrionales bacterium RIFOXYD12_FULL_39_22]|nr:MAG: hypothetical protein A2385_13660 [Bdellovibrionales bacterium RIFOXYB1_FULL_39_21]OFZ44880.1 MAG: hypothetical protein A2485_14870 [Bdellovibrionales bacterium RIFOXYC12_FULL_39_17]OFZ49398.1 MAG: hypothetical protein A2404_09205 [Bdellovibrionales bacterium RIFOXYC1_FULL_39_130]OFZ77119.1 MAG: hypothetical protein A2560_10855 [Bdellovibrionales bacterium RIFOXYD1_FULL_39_84]OFZ95580.1 MAG: hypothetical protein A2504_08035 [Bdellovibrionales bacterium RIFOXYD12_FULL_39_22]
MIKENLNVRILHHHFAVISKLELILKTILITGADGFLGKNIFLKWQKQFHLKAFILPENKNAFQHFLANNAISADVIAGKFSDSTALASALENAHYVIHCAGNMLGAKWDRYFSANVESVRLLLDKIPSSVERIVLISSQAAQGPSPDHKKITIDTPSAPLSFYGKSKLLGETIALEHKTTCPITILRPCSFFGPFDKSFLDIFKMAKKGTFGTLFDKEKFFQLLYVDDLIAAIALALKDTAFRSKYFVAPAEVLSWQNFYDALVEITGKKLLWVNLPPFVARIYLKFFDLIEIASGKPQILGHDKARDMSQKYWICDSTPFIDKFAFKPQFSFRDGVQQTWMWYNEKKWI